MRFIKYSLLGYFAYSLIVVLPLFSCKLPFSNSDSSKNNNESEKIIYCGEEPSCEEKLGGETLKGQVLYVGDNYARYGALGVRVGAYQNNQEMACTIITSDSGYYELTGLDTGIYDIVYITDSLYMSIKLPDVIISKGINHTSSQFPYEQINETLWSYSYTDLEKKKIYLSFKDYVTDQEEEELITESNCTNVKPFIEGWYELQIPEEELVDCVIKWFLKKNEIADVEFSTRVRMDPG